MAYIDEAPIIKENAFANPNQPYGMAPQSESPPWWRVAQSNAKGFSADPKNQVAMAMLAQQLSKMGPGMSGMGLQQPQAGSHLMVPGFDLYGNPIS